MKESTLNSVKTQQEASDPRNNVYLSASAGTGKTKTLVDRILRLLLSGVKAGDILCITFTNAAANEMLERLRARVKGWFLMNDKQLSADIKSLTGLGATEDSLNHAKQLYRMYLDNIDMFRIQTLHSFCTEVLNQLHYIDENKLDKVKIIDNYTKNKFVKKSCEKVITFSNSKVEIDFAINMLGQKYDYVGFLSLMNNLISSKEKLYKFFTSEDSIQDLINEQYEFYHADKDRNAQDIIEEFIDTNPNEFIDAIKDLHAVDDEIISIIKCWFSEDKRGKVDNLNRYIDCFLTKVMTPKIRLPFDKRFKDHNPSFIEAYKVEQERIVNFLECKNSQEQAEFMKCIIIFLNQLTEEYEYLKEEQKYFEYDDLILKTLELFENTQDAQMLLFSLNLSLSHVLIDEAQDLSKIQWILIQQIIKSATNASSSVFIVGDYKQSIYGFQGAEPKYFMDINELYKMQFHKEGRAWKALELTHSFRSQKEVLAAVDKVFNATTATTMGHKLAHIAIKDGAGKVQVIEYSYRDPKKTKHVGWVLPKRYEDVPNKKKHNSIELADFVSRLLSKSENAAKDIMVLFRKRGERIRYFIEELKKRNIQVADTSSIDFNRNVLVLDMLSLIKFFLLPEDDLNLVCLLKSPFFNLTEEELFYVAHDRGEKNVFDMLLKSHTKIRKRLIQLKEDYESNSLQQFFANLLYKYKFIVNFYKEYGKNTQEIVELFLNKVSEFECNYQKGTQSFLEWIKDNSQVIVENNNADGVNVITSHAAKGLQSPIVIIADASDSEDLPVDAYFWQEDRLIVSYSNQYEITALTKAKSEKYTNTKQESLRLLYVAMTRAENELYIFGSNKSKKDSWYSITKDILSENFIQYENITWEVATPKAAEEVSTEHNQLPIFLYKDYIADLGVRTESASKGEQMHSDLAVIRGNFIHKVLYEVTKILEYDRVQYIKNLAKTPEFDIIPHKEIDEIAKVTMDIIKQLPDIFYGENILSEVGVKSRRGNTQINAIIDRMIVHNASVDIIEIKADKAKLLAETSIAPEYKQQLEIYKKCVSEIYPEKKINCKILSFYQKKLICL
jgi:ATP-dependent helicase/nuclease subunit A